MNQKQTIVKNVEQVFNGFICNKYKPYGRPEQLKIMSLSMPLKVFELSNTSFKI